MASYRVIVCGSGPIALATARLLAGMDFEGVLAAPRSALPVRRRVPGAVRRVVCEYQALGSRLDLGERDFLVIATRVLASDRACLRQALASPAWYIGLVSSRSRWAGLKKALREAGVSARDLRRVCCPAGLDIGSITPDEIGLSIVSQLVQERARRLFGRELFRHPPARVRSREPRSKSSGEGVR